MLDVSVGLGADPAFLTVSLQVTES